ncbi:hypothetical protein C8255_06150 [filamentous cyanobacterium CCP3]|nr:hypothetical protein C8255_06150 [filamentous cyanobacterium CCP3]
MTNIHRRHFLQGAVGALGAIGLSQLHLENRALRYGQALAQDTRRKVGLLVGINAYSARDRLYGPLTDVELQRQLLIHRFGFNPNDIHTLTDANATRANILGTFDEYLLNSVGPEDVVVLHFSGHGARVNESEIMRSLLDQANLDCIDANCLNTALVPVDYGGDGGPVQGIMGHTLLLMRSVLPTDNVTLVLDCCYAGGGKRGNVIMRSHLTDLELRTSTAPAITLAESEYQQTLLSRLNWGTPELIDQIRSQQGKGFVAASSRANQQSADYPFDGFTAGAFTYLLTQYLWHETRPLSVTIPAIASGTTRLSKHSQVPEYDPQGVSRTAEAPIYHLDPVAPAAEAVLIETPGPKANGQVSLWLGGLDPLSLEAFDNSAEFTQVDQAGNPIGTIKLLRRDGLMATGEVIEQSAARSATPATPLLQERLRGIPATITLRVGLDDTLTAAEQAIATDQLKALTFIEWVSVEPGRSPKPPHVLLGRYTSAIESRMALSGVVRRPPVNSLGLFSTTQEPLMVESFGDPGEAMADALNRRLKPQFTSLLIGRMLALMVNQTASHINVSLAVEHQGSRSSTTTRGGSDSAIIIPQLTAQGIEPIPVDNRITITVTNHEAYPLHLGLLVIDAAGEVTVLYPPTSDDVNSDRVAPRAAINLPALQAVEPYGITQLLVMASPNPLQSALRTLRRIAPTLRGSSNEASPEEVMRDMFNTLDSRRSSSLSLSGPRLLDVNTIAALSLLFEIVPAS